MTQHSAILKTHNFLGYAWGEADAPRYLSIEDRRRHMLITGAPGTGKSVLLANLFAQEVNNGRGVLLMDNHGDLAKYAVDLVSPFRRHKTIVFRPSDLAYPIVFNPLYRVPRAQQALRVADLVATFRSLWDHSWGPRLEHTLTFTLAALIAQGDATLLSIPKFLLNRKYRTQLLENVTDPQVRFFWLKEFELYERTGPETVTPILNKVDAFFTNPAVRNVLGYPKSAFDPRHLIDNGYVVVADLSGIGAEPANLIGSLLISSFASAAKSREDIPPDERRPYTLIIDEFTSYSNNQFSTLLSEMRKFNLSLILAHQYLDQMSRDDLQKAALGVIGSFIVLRVSGSDAKKFAEGPLSDYPPEVYVNTANTRAYCRLLQNGHLSTTFELSLPKPPKVQREPGKTVAHSRHQWATDPAKIREYMLTFFAEVLPKHPAPNAGFWDWKGTGEFD